MISGPLSCFVFPFRREFQKFKNCTVKLSAKETKWTSLEVRTHPAFPETLISKCDSGPVKLPGLSRNGPLAGNTVLCLWARHFTLTLLSTQVYKWVPANFMLRVTLRWTSIQSRGVEILLVASYYRNRDKPAGLVGHIGPYADFNFTLFLLRKI